MTWPPIHHAARCPRCCLKLGLCLCAEIPQVPTRTRLIVLRHQREVGKTSNTGRLAALALGNCVLHDIGVIGRPLPADALPASDAWVLYPEPGREAPPTDASPPRFLVVLDGSWPQARHMMQRLPALRAMPRLVLPGPTRDFVRLRAENRAAHMSTIEAIAGALERLEGSGCGGPLLDLYARFLERSAPGRRGPKWGKARTCET